VILSKTDEPMVDRYRLGDIFDPPIFAHLSLIILGPKGDGYRV
jgi:hypothetical protein